MNKKLLIVGASAALLASCGGSDESSENNSKDNNSDTTATETVEEVTKDVAINPFPNFPKGSIKASAGDYVLTPSVKWQKDATTGNAADQTFIFYNAKMSAPGDENSTVDFTFDGEVDIPNYMIVPIKSGQTAKKGDIVLSWWQTGSGMQRAIVVDDSNPSEPVVNYIDLDWDNPATDESGVGIGQATYSLKPNSFHVLGSAWEPGTTVAVKNGSDYKAATVISVNGDQVLTLGFAGKMAVQHKADCTPIEVIPNVKAGDMVQAPWVGTYKNVKVIKVDNEMGRVWTEDPYSDDPMVIAYGDVTTGLPIN